MQFAELFPNAPERFLNKLSQDGDCIVWTGATQRNRGYGLLWFKDRNRSTHRLAYEFAKGPIPAGLVVMHSCDRPQCVNPAHLSVGTHAENQFDKVRKNRHAKGSRQGHAKLTEVGVADIRRRVSHGERQTDLAKEYGVSIGTVNGIVHNRWWRHAA